MVEKYIGEVQILTEKQKDQFNQLEVLYQEWNKRINVISRKDIGEIMLHHIIHSLAIAKCIRFREGTSVMDVGTGGGFPGVPLAILMPDVHFLLIDSIGKKVMVAQDVIKTLGLNNCEVRKARAEETSDKVDFVVSRAVMLLKDLVKIVQKNIATHSDRENVLPNGVLCLKGGDLTDEVKMFKNIVEIYDISMWWSDDFFQTKKVVYLPISGYGK